MRLGLTAIALAAAACSQPHRPARAIPAPSDQALARSPPPDAAPPGSTGQPFAKSRSYQMSAGQVGQVWLVCDPIEAGARLVVTLPDSRGTVFMARPGLGGTQAAYSLGRPDPGAGQVYWPLTDAAGKPAGHLHAFNPGALGSPGDAFTPTFTSISRGDVQTSCRWVPRTRFLGIDAGRTYLVTQAADGTLTYQAFSFEGGARRPSVPTLTIKGGRETASGFAFQNNGYDYLLQTGPGPAWIELRKHGVLLQRLALSAWTLAPTP